VAKWAAISSGIVMFAIAGLAYTFEITPTGLTIPQVNDLCASGMGQLGQMFSGDVLQICREYGYLMYGIYGLGIGGLILIIVGSVVPGKKSITVCEYCNLAFSTEAELYNHKNTKEHNEILSQQNEREKLREEINETRSQQKEKEKMKISVWYKTIFAVVGISIAFILIVVLVDLPFIAKIILNS